MQIKTNTNRVEYKKLCIRQKISVDIIQWEVDEIKSAVFFGRRQLMALSHENSSVTDKNQITQLVNNQIL